MAMLSLDELKTLTENPQNPCVSIYLPMQKAGPEIRQNPIRFKNLIRAAEERLDAIGISHQEAMEWLSSAHQLDKSDFWEHQDRGLAIFISKAVFRYYRLPVEFPELVIVTNRFHLKPLLPLFTNDEQFYILALSQKDVRLLEGTRYSVKEIELENVPKSMDEALQYDETAQEGQFRISTSRGGTANSAVQAGTFHGQGSPDRDDIKQDLLQFFHAIDAGLHEKLRRKTAPLVLAGVEYLFPIYQEANTYQHLVEEGITGNPENLKPEELHDQALQIVEPLFQKHQHETIERYQELAGADTGKASRDLKEIVPAAFFQRVDSLLVAGGQQYWGRFDPDTMKVELHQEPEPDDEDLLDFCAIHTLLNGGAVYVVEPEKVPAEASAAAIFRY
ncbi:MAG: hypothetical protein JOZ78_15295 [Chroococcidiopsidaceae cyanobacterium CP_BM_ER_R8_30]|nr:hypothetical protein [Chroococcidiopsidaceae cyanobacterium CP_BM_ER_R8_30]